MRNLNNILVVGAGVAGPVVCYWLKRFGFSPTLIERSENLRKGGFAIDIRGIATEIIKKMGIYDEIVSRRTQLENGCYVDALGNKLFEEEAEVFGFRQGEEVEIVRGDLIDVLMNAIEEIPCYYHQAIQDIKQHEDFVEVSFKDGSKKQYSLVIGADGLHSSVRNLIFAEEDYELLNLGAYISVFSLPNYLNLRHTERLFEIDQKLVHYSSDKDPQMAQAGFMFRTSHVLDDVRDEKAQKKLLRDLFFNAGWESNKLLELMDTTNDFYFDSITQVKMRAWTKGRVALLGDAGYCASPLSGQGTSLAIVGAYILAGELMLAKGNFPHAFRQYNELLRPFVEANQRFGLWVAETYLVAEQVTKEAAEERTGKILEKMQIVSNAIALPAYE